MGHMTGSVGREEDEHMLALRLPIVDVGAFSQDELRLLAGFSAQVAMASMQDLVVPVPKIDRAIFNESAGSRKQTYSKWDLKQGPRQMDGIPLHGKAGLPRTISASQTRPPTQFFPWPQDPTGGSHESSCREVVVLQTKAEGSPPEKEDGPQGCTNKKQMQGYAGAISTISPAEDMAVEWDTTGKNRGRGSNAGKRRRDMQGEGSISSGGSEDDFARSSQQPQFTADRPMGWSQEEADKSVTISELQRASSQVDLNGENENIEDVRIKDDRVEEMMKRLESMDGKWSTYKMKRKIVDARGFPKGWTVCVGLRHKSGRLFFEYRQWRSPEGKMWGSFKEAAAHMVATLQQATTCKDIVTSPATACEGGPPSRHLSLHVHGLPSHIPEGKRTATNSSEPDRGGSMNRDIPAHIQQEQGEQVSLQECDEAIEDWKSPRGYMVGGLDASRIEHPPLLQVQQPIPAQLTKPGENKCPTCYKEFRKGSLLRKHLRRSKHTRTFNCDVCGLFWSSKAMLLAHRVSMGHAQGAATNSMGVEQGGPLEGNHEGVHLSDAFESPDLPAHRPSVRNHHSKKSHGAVRGPDQSGKRKAETGMDGSAVGMPATTDTKNGTFECETCHKVFNEQPKYWGHLSLHSKKRKVQIVSLGGSLTNSTNAHREIEDQSITNIDSNHENGRADDERPGKTRLGDENPDTRRLHDEVPDKTEVDNEVPDRTGVDDQVSHKTWVDDEVPDKSGGV